MKPPQIRAVRNMGFTQLRECQHKLTDAAMNYQDVLFQSRGGTGKSTGLGFLISEFCNPREVTYVVAPRVNLVTQLILMFRKFLSHQYTEVLTVDESVSRIDWSSPVHFVIVGVPAHLSVLQLPKSVLVQAMYFDEADELFGDSLLDYSNQCLSRFLDESTRTVFLSATFPPYIVSRIEDGLQLAISSRVDTPYQVHLCVSTSTDALENSVLSHVRYHGVVANDMEGIQVFLKSILKNIGKGRCIVFGGSRQLASSLKGLSVEVISKTSLTESTAQVLVDINSYCSRGLNIPNLTIGVAIGFTDKETLLHQFGRIAREENARGDFYVVVSEKNQLDFLSFQLGIDFEIFSFSLHPFEIHYDTNTRWKCMLDKISRAKSQSLIPNLYF